MENGLLFSDTGDLIVISTEDPCKETAGSHCRKKIYTVISHRFSHYNGTYQGVGYEWQKVNSS